MRVAEGKQKHCGPMTDLYQQSTLAESDLRIDSGRWQNMPIFAVYIRAGKHTVT